MGKIIMLLAETKLIQLILAEVYIMKLMYQPFRSLADALQDFFFFFFYYQCVVCLISFLAI